MNAKKEYRFCTYARLAARAQRRIDRARRELRELELFPQAVVVIILMMLTVGVIVEVAHG